MCYVVVLGISSCHSVSYDNPSVNHVTVSENLISGLRYPIVILHCTLKSLSVILQHSFAHFVAVLICLYVVFGGRKCPEESLVCLLWLFYGVIRH